MTYYCVLCDEVFPEKKCPKDHDPFVIWSLKPNYDANGKLMWPGDEPPKKEKQE